MATPQVRDIRWIRGGYYGDPDYDALFGVDFTMTDYTKASDQ